MVRRPSSETPSEPSFDCSSERTWPSTDHDSWINWALNVFTLLWRNLSSVYEKMRRGSFPFQKLSVNNSISNKLRWMADHMDHSNIIDSWEWARSEAHDTFLCDACPTGMGYWSPRTCEGFVCAVSSSTRHGIFFFKALTVLSALSHVCESPSPQPRRLAILTNSLNTFDMFNTLHALPAYNPILITAVDLLLASNIQLRVFHIPHNENKVADALSHLDCTTARWFHPGLVVTRFSPPWFMMGEAQLWFTTQLCPDVPLGRPGLMSTCVVNVQSLFPVLLNQVWLLLTPLPLGRILLSVPLIISPMIWPRSA